VTSKLVNKTIKRVVKTDLFLIRKWPVSDEDAGTAGPALAFGITPACEKEQQKKCLTE